MDALLIIDMQPGFKAASHPLVLGKVCFEAGRACERGDRVVLLEYHGLNGIAESTHSAICHCCPDARVRVKRRDDGGDDVMDDLRDCGKVWIVGCNRHACVEETAASLKFLLPKLQVVVIESACGDAWGIKPPPEKEAD